MTEHNNDNSNALGDYVRRLREAAGLSVRGLAATARVDWSWLAKLEHGTFASPDPRALWRLAQALDVEVAELYQAAGYGDGLPGFAPYLRARYGLPEEAVAQLEAHFALINDKYSEERRTT
ncbi:MAG: helix-turn-helix domain-containing protein [Gemmatimonadaceae bacterium]